MRHAASVREHNRAVTAPNRPRWTVLTAVALVALNLRTALASVPTVESDIQAATGWSETVIGALTMLPVLCMGAFALVVPRLARRIGRRQTVALALAIITVSLILRLAALVPGVLHLSALLAGIGIALAAGLVPAIVREQLPDAVGVATGMWTAAMLLGAALGGVLTVPLAHLLGSWQAALAAWALPSALALLVWWLVEEKAVPHAPHAAGAVPAPAVRVRDLPWRSRPAWALTGFLLTNSIIFYTTLAWLAPAYVHAGSTKQGAALLFGLFTGTEIIGALAFPAIAERVRHRRAFYAAAVVVTTITLALIAWDPNLATVAVASVFGVVLGGTFAMGLALLSEWGVDAPSSARLTAMAFSVTYLTASFGPLVAGGLLDVTQSWALVFALLVAASIGQLITVPALRRGVRIS
jgi:MFS transporter, CP family, cyanate transporter